MERGAGTQEGNEPTVAFFSHQIHISQNLIILYLHKVSTSLNSLYMSENLFF